MPLTDAQQQDQFNAVAHIDQKTDALIAKVDQLLARPVLSAAQVTEIKQYVAQQVVAALTGVNGHLIPDGDVDRISDGVLDRMSVRLAQ